MNAEEPLKESIHAKEEELRRLAESRFPIVLLHQLDIDQHRQKDTSPKGTGVYKKTSEETLVLRGKILSLYKIGHRVGKIARLMGINRKTVSKWIRREAVEGKLSDHRGGKPPRRTTSQQDIAILQASQDNPLHSAKHIREKLAIGVCAQTVRRRLHDQGRRAWCTPNEPNIDER